MKRPLCTMNGLSVFIMLLWYIDSIIGARQDAAKRQTATQKIDQEGVGGMTVLIEQMKLMQVATIRVEDEILSPLT